MGLSKKHFEKIAEILNTTKRGIETGEIQVYVGERTEMAQDRVVNRITYELVDYFQTENNGFDKERFIRAVNKEVEC